MIRLCPALATALLLMSTTAQAQVSLDPPSLLPNGWARIAVQVANQTDTAWIAVRTEVPDVVHVLGVDAPVGWNAHVVPATDTTPKAIEWSGGRIEPGRFQEFAFLGRLQADVRRKNLYFPVRLTWEGGSTLTWRRGGEAPPLWISITGTTRVSSWGAFALAGVAFGVAVLAFALAVRRQER